jgi:hypothetical protein
VGTTAPAPDGQPDLELQVGGLDLEKEIENVTVHLHHGTWQLKGNGNWYAAVERDGTEMAVYVANFLKEHGTVPGFVIGNVSMHDNGWEGYPIDENPYVVHFSRGVFGYASLLSPMVPLFFSGEEFSAEFRPNTELSYTCFERTAEKDGKERRKQWEEELGRGRWLYGSWLDWTQLEKTKHKTMLADVRKMLAIRHANSDLIYARQRHERVDDILPVAAQSNIGVPVPYAYFNNGKILVVSASYDTNKVAELILNIPIEKMGMKAKRFVVEDLWNGEKKTVSATELKALKLSIKPDKTPGGGIGVLKITPKQD